MKYQESIRSDMKWLAEQEKTIFIGQGLIKGDRIYHTLDNVPLDRCIEMPIAENLIMGVANGLALRGWRPVVVFQRMDFMLIAADQIINHTALIEEMSNGQFKCPVIIRACVGSQSRKFDVGPQHRHDFRHIFERYVSTLWYDKGVYQMMYKEDIYGETPKPVIIVEEKDKYNEEV